MTFTYQAHESRCIKCNNPNKIDYHREMAWCCKANFKTNSPRLKTKKGKLCSHSFKCVNYKG